METLTTPTIEQRVTEAFTEDFGNKFPQHQITEGFKSMVAHYISLSAGASRTAIIEDILQFLKECERLESQIPVATVIEYLNNTDFITKIKCNEYETTARG